MNQGFWETPAQMVDNAHDAAHHAGLPHFCTEACFERNASEYERLIEKAALSLTDEEHAHFIRLAEAAR